MPSARELIDEGIRYETAGVLDRALAAYRAACAADGDPGLRAEGRRREADVLRSRCEWDAALEAARASAALAREANLDSLVAEALNAEGAVHQSLGELDQAAGLYRRMLGLTDDLRVRGIALQNLGAVAAMKGDFEEAEDRFIESFECFQRGGYRRGVVFALNNYGRAALDRGADAVAHPVLERAEADARELMDLDLLALVRLNLAESLLRRHEIDEAQDLASAALGFFGNTRNEWRRLECLRLLGDITAAQERADSARRFFEAALRIALDVGARREVDMLRSRLALLQT